MTTEQFIKEYFAAIHAGNWESYIADDIVFIVNNTEQPMSGKAVYLERAGRFFRTTTAIELKEIFINDSKAAVLAHYQTRSPKDKIGTCDVAEFLTIKGGELTASSIFFDTKALADFMAAD